MSRGADIFGGSVLESSKQTNVLAALAIVILSAPFAMAADGDMTSEELTALVGTGIHVFFEENPCCWSPEF